MNRPVTLDFCFKGDRTYVHGTDLYTAITKFLDQNGITALSAIDMTIHQICRTNLSGEWVVASQNQTAPKAAAVFRFQGEQRNSIIHLAENGVPITCRYPYSEDAIDRMCHIDVAGQNISAGQTAGYSNIEAIVAMNKALLKALFPQADGKWYFTRLQLIRPIHDEQWSNLELQFQGHFNLKITKTSIRADGHDFGYIYFSLVK